MNSVPEVGQVSAPGERGAYRPREKGRTWSGERRRNINQMMSKIEPGRAAPWEAEGETGQMGGPPAPSSTGIIAGASIGLCPGGNESPPRTLALFPARDPHHAHRCSLPRARPASFRNSSWRNSMVAALAAGAAPGIPPPAGPGGRVRVPGVRPGPAGPAAPLGGKEAASEGCLGAVTELSVGGGAGRGPAHPSRPRPWQ